MTFEKNGITCDTEFDYVWSEDLGFCCCGRSEATAKWMVRALKHIDKLITNRPPENEWDAHYVRWKAETVELYGGMDGACYFFWYWCDAKGFTEHGGSVPGWLTMEGRNFLAELEHVLAKEREGEE